MNITDLLRLGQTQGASDLHLAAGLPPLLRIDGDLRRLDLPVLNHQQVHSHLIELMNDKQRQEYETRFECDFSFELPNLARFRVNAFRQNRGAGGAFRTIPVKIPSLDELGMGEVFRSIAATSHGLITVTGPTGSGKSTSLAAMIDYINSTRHKHILTLEDPIEFVHENKQCLVNQREIHRDTLGFNEALRSALRADPDIILIGEMRDLATIRLALEAAETGHLVLSTLHTSAAARTIDRMINVFPGAEKAMIRTLLSESLHAVISQTLLKKVAGGRVAAHEIMVCTPAIRNLIREDKVPQIYSAIQTGRNLGMQTFDQCLAELVANKIISKETAQQEAKMPEDFR